MFGEVLCVSVWQGLAWFRMVFFGVVLSCTALLGTVLSSCAAHGVVRHGKEVRR